MLSWKAYEAAVKAFAKDRAIPVIHFAKGDNKEEIARPYLEAAATVSLKEIPPRAARAAAS